MPGVRIDRLLASTAAILLLAGAASIASAEPKFGTAAETATAPAATGAPSGEINRSAKPAQPSSQAPMAAPAAKPQARADHAVVAIVKPEDIRDSSPASASAPAEEKTEQPAAAPAEAAPAEQPAATATPTEAAPTEQPAATAAPSEPAEPAAAEANPAEPATAAAPAEPATTGTTPAPTVTEAPATQPTAAATATGGDEVPGRQPNRACRQCGARRRIRPPPRQRPHRSSPMPTRRSPRNCANSPMASSTASSAARRIGRLSTPITPPTATRRSGSPTANSTRAPRRRSPISARSMPTASIRPIIRCRTSPRLSPIPLHWRKPKCGSPPRS